jgi:MFS family permease
MNTLIRSRISVVAAFLVPGFVLGMYAVNIPGLKEHAGLTSGALGSVFVFGGVGAIVGNQLAGFAVDRFGSRIVTIVGAVLTCLAIVPPALAPNAFALAPLLFVFGIALGGVDVSMNQQAVIVQRAYGRPIMASFHAFYSIGGALGTVLGGLTLVLGLPLVVSLALAGLVGLGFVLVAATGLSAADVADSPVVVEGTPDGRHHMPRIVWLLGFAAMLLMLSEGVANDWSSLQITQRLGEPPAIAALGYGAFAVAMTVARLFGDRVAGRLGAVRTVRFGTLIGAVGLAVIVLSPWLPLTIAGWAILGFGLSGCVPQIFTAAGNVPTSARGVVMSRVVALGYFGLLAGPAVIGWTSQATSISAALVIPLVCCLVVAAIANVVRPRASVPEVVPRVRTSRSL